MVPPTAQPPTGRRSMRAALIGAGIIIILAGGVYAWQRISLAQESASTLHEAQTAANQGLYLQAVSDLTSMSSNEPNYQEAQMDVKLLKNAAMYYTLRKAVLGVQGSIDSDMVQFWSDYNATIKPDNAAWQVFPSVDVPDTTKAGPYVSSLSNDSGNVSTDFTDLEAVYGDATTNAASLGALSQSVTACRQMSIDSGIMSNDILDEWDSLKSGSYGSYSSISQGISNANKLLNTVNADQTQVDGLLTQYASAAVSQERKDLSETSF